ncbi:MAG TPA: YceI family protein [Solirubrobacteraceae bacterium]|nr:YceI family protein [Solirubrobacteraceae bacterium]
MALPPGTYALGPEQAALTVRTGTAGAAARTGHNLVIEVQSWSAELRIGTEPFAMAIQLTADPASLRVREGRGGLQPLREEDRRAIERRIGREVLGSGTIAFRSARAEPADGALHADGELELHGRHGPVSVVLRVDGSGRLSASATIMQTAFGIKPYSAMFGRLKVRDEVQVALEGRLPAG